MMTGDAAILDRLNGDFRRLAEIVGVENALKISREFGGLWISIPKLDSLKKEVRDAGIRAEYDAADGSRTDTVRRLARKHDLTSRQIYNILGMQPDDEIDLILPLFKEIQPVK